MIGRFDGRVAIITGGSRGIGKEIGKSLGKDGACMAILDVDQEAMYETAEELQRDGIKVITHYADVRDLTVVEKAVHHVNKRFGRIDILVNNAGIIRDSQLFKMNSDDW